MAESNHIIIIGAGVTGLQTAISLLTSPETSNFKIDIIAEHVPSPTPDPMESTYSSPWAGGLWHSHAGLSDRDAEIRDWDKRTYEFWAQLLNGDEEGTKETYEDRVNKIGLGFKEHQYYWGKHNSETKSCDGSGLWWKDVVNGFEVLDMNSLKEDEKAPPGAVFGVKYQTICINPAKYLGYLFEKVVKLGATVLQTSLKVEDGLEGLVRDAKQALLKEKVPNENIFVLINCTGLEARRFVGSKESSKLIPLLGQTLLVEGEAKVAGTYVDFNEDWEVAYVIPRPGSETTILGGCNINMKIHDWDQNVAGNMNSTMARRTRIWGIADELRICAEEGTDGFESLGFQVGFSPVRKGGPRVEVQEGGKIEGVWVVHAYGHAVSGYQNSVGSAEKVVKLVSGL